MHFAPPGAALNVSRGVTLRLHKPDAIHEGHLIWLAQLKAVVETKGIVKK